MRFLSLFVSAGLLAACTSTPTLPPTVPPPPPTEVQLLAINDFHGNLAPPGLSYEGSKGKVAVGGAAYLVSALKALRTGRSLTVAAGDLISASPLESSLFYDEPAIKVLSDGGLALSTVGNHEFDRGPDELLRMQNGGCRVKKAGELRESCKLEQFAGARFQYLAANVVKADGSTLFPSTALRDVGGIRIGFIGVTLRETGVLVSPAAVEGLTFTDEAGTANALVPYLKANGAQAIVLLIHQGGKIDGKFDDEFCPGLSGAIVPILDRLDPAINVVISGHTHNAYICRIPAAGGGQRLLTSAGKFGGMITNIRMGFAPDGTYLDAGGTFVPVQGEGSATPARPVPVNSAYTLFSADGPTAELVARYREAAKSVGGRPVGTLPGILTWADVGEVSMAAEFIADAQYFAAKDADKGGADFALMNAGGARTEIVPAADGTVSYSQIFTMQPFANNVVTIALNGADVMALMEQQFDSGLNTVARPNLLMPSANVRYAFDRSRRAGHRMVSMTVDGKPIDPEKTYRVAINDFLAAGGDNFSVFTRGRNPVIAGPDLDATEAYLRTKPPLPRKDRVVDLTPKGWKPAA